MKRINSCRVCESPNITEFMNLGEQPYANSLIKSPDEEEMFYPLSLSFCKDCSLVQLNHTAEPKDLFSSYLWVTSTSKTAKEHSKILYNDIIQRVKNLKDSYVLEVGSNDGTFLFPFAQNNYSVLGVDPAKNIAEMAEANGIPTKSRFFGARTANEIVSEKGKAKLVMARNVLPHVANTHDFVDGLHTCLQDDGLLVLEVHYAKKINEELHYDSIYHEHLCYFTLKSLEKLLNAHDFFVTDIGKSPISGGSIVVYAKKKKSFEAKAVRHYRNLEKKTRMNELIIWENFAKRAEAHREELLGILNNNEKTVGYGASARSSTLLNYCGIGTNFISEIADQNPLKHKYYTAGTHIPIDSPENVMKKNPANVFILAWNFGDEIIKALKDKFNYKGKCILPLPNSPRVIGMDG
jgi:SAM-dependent methyltransferase